MRVTLLSLALLIALGVEAQAQTTKSNSPAQPLSAAEKYFTNTELVDQNGKPQRFYADVLKGKVIVINAFFSTCKGICLPMNRNFKKVADLLGDKVGRDVFLVSITVDPEMDTPETLKQYASNLNAPAGWMFLTGTKANVDFVLNKLGQYVADKNDHTSVMIIGNEKTGLWKKAFGMAKPEELEKVIQSVIDDKGAGQ